MDKAWEVVNEIIQKGHDNGSISMWGTLLSACVDLGNIVLGKFAAQKALELDPQNAGIYVCYPTCMLSWECGMSLVS